ncbi:MAG: hypothetical protein H6930_10820 [Rhodoferax sp.]|jgi:hypothetical protein|nr:hypothetical protein [Rhodoferax sp.]
MNVTEKFQHAMAEGEPLYWENLCIELEAEHAAVQSQRERENLLALFTIMSDKVERNHTDAKSQDEFKDERQRIYHRLLLREACLGGTLCAKTLFAVTEREYFNGRMLQDDPMRSAAQAGFVRFSQMAGPVSEAPAACSSAHSAAVDGSRGPWYLWLIRMMAQIRLSSVPTHGSM